MSVQVLVVKLGTAVLTDATGNINEEVIRKVARDIALLTRQYRILVVSSGAVGSGKKYLRQYRGTLLEQKAAAAIGNPLLIDMYRRHFSSHGVTVAQALCERVHFSNRSQFLQLKQTFGTLWDNGILPIVNENDLVSNVELKFSDNDELATLLAVGFDAGKLLLCTSAGGFLDEAGKTIPLIEKIDGTITKLVRSEKTGPGLGGMISKLTFTRLAVSLGIEVIICGIAGERPFSDALEGRNGSVFAAGPGNFRSRQKWLASGSITLGTIRVDKGAAAALAQRKSLLTVGIQEVQGKFGEGEVVQLVDPEGTIMGVAKTRLGAAAMKEQLRVKNVLAAHADDIVIF